MEEGKVAQQPSRESLNVLGSALWNLGLNGEPSEWDSWLSFVIQSMLKNLYILNFLFQDSPLSFMASAFPGHATEII